MEKNIQTFIATEVEQMLGERIEKIHQKTINKFLPTNVKAGTNEYQLWNDDIFAIIFNEIYHFVVHHPFVEENENTL